MYSIGSLKELDRGVCDAAVTAELYRIEGKLVDLHSLYSDTQNDPHFVLGRLRRDTIIRKIRKFRERYPDIKVKLFTRRDFERLGQKYGLNLVT